MRTYLVLLAILGAISFYGCSQSNSEQKLTIEISEDEKVLLDSIDFDYNVLEAIRLFSDSAVHLKTTSYNFYDNSTNSVETEAFNHIGIEFNADQDEAREIVFSLKDQLKDAGYLMYVSDVNFGYSPDQVTVIKSNDQFDILRTEQTDAINYDFENKDVVAKLQKWDSLYHFQIIGASMDWIEAIFIREPSNMRKFSQELYEFCPDVVDQGVGTVEELEKSMNETGILYLWWD